MDNDELISQISSMMEQQTLHFASILEQNLEPIRNDITFIKLKIENDIERSISALAEGHQGLVDKFAKIDQMADDLEEMKGALVAVELEAKHLI